MVEECVKDNYYANFILPAVTAAEKCTLFLDNINFLDYVHFDKSVEREM